MKNTIFTILLAVFAIAIFPSCETVPSGHRGVRVEWGGQTDTSKVYGEGVQYGLAFLVDDLIPYDVRETTVVQKYEFNDKNNMTTKVEMSLDYNLNPRMVNTLHADIKDIETKILKTMKSAAKEVIPQYSAVELNITKRQEAEDKLSKILESELPAFYVEFARIQMTDVDIPPAVAELAKQTAVQLGKNQLAEKKEAEQVALAKARVAEAQGEYDAAQLQAKTKAILSQPQMLKLTELDIEQTYAEGYLKHGTSRYGTGNWYGTNAASVLKSVK